MAERASIDLDDNDLDLSGFAPAKPAPAVPPEAVRGGTSIVPEP